MGTDHLLFMKAAALFPYSTGESEAMATAWLYRIMARWYCSFSKQLLAAFFIFSTALDRGLESGRCLIKCVMDNKFTDRPDSVIDWRAVNIEIAEKLSDLFTSAFFKTTLYLSASF